MSFDVVAGLWVSEKKPSIDNAVHAAVLWVICNTRNDTHFNKTPWSNVQVLWRKIGAILSQWLVLFSEDAKGRMTAAIGMVENLARAHPPLLWPDPG